MTLLDVLRDFNVPFIEADAGHRHVRPGFLGIDCPYCSPYSLKYKLGFRLSSLLPSCWSCGVFRLDEVLQEILKIQLQEARKLAYQLRGSIQEYAPYRNQRPRQGTLKIPAGVGPLLSQHRSYLKQRGFDPDKLEKLWGIGGIGLASRLSWRIFIPITANGEVVSWTTRSISDEVEPKYVNASPDEEAYPLKHQIFGLDYVRHAAIVCEGPLDAIRIGPGGAALMGVSYSQEQIEKLSKIPVRVVALDAEPMAQRQARKLVKELSAWPGETYKVALTSGKDASRAAAEDVQELRERFLD